MVKKEEVVLVIRPVLQSHNHKKDRPSFMCTTCAAVFRTQKRLEEHVAVKHRDPGSENTFLCQSCPKTFPTKITLKRHVDMTHPPAMIQCRRCDKSYGHAKWLVLHICQTHIGNEEGRKAFTCAECGQKAVLRYCNMFHTFRFWPYFLIRRPSGEIPVNAQD